MHGSSRTSAWFVVGGARMCIRVRIVRRCTWLVSDGPERRGAGVRTVATGAFASAARCAFGTCRFGGSPGRAGAGVCVCRVRIRAHRAAIIRLGRKPLGPPCGAGATAACASAARQASKRRFCGVCAHRDGLCAHVHSAPGTSGTRGGRRLACLKIRTVCAARAHSGYVGAPGAPSDARFVSDVCVVRSGRCAHVH